MLQLLFGITQRGDSMTEKPNIILMMVDQLRFDTLGVNGHEIVSTPNLDMMAKQGYNFENAYSAVPTCIPSRAALLTGLNQRNHHRVGYEDGIPWEYEKTIAKEFASLGYQTEAIGKMHVYPERNRLGFEHVLLHDGYLHEGRKYRKSTQSQFEQVDDYLKWLKNKKGSDIDIYETGLDCNSWVARPWIGEEAVHPTNWIVTESIDFLKRRDPTQPFFLKMSFARPHSPLDPPEYYFNMYMNQKEKFPEINIGDWAKEFIGDPDFSTIALKGDYSKDDMDRMMAGYYGLITHIDHQIGRFLIALTEHDLDKNTIVLFLSDHGDQLGEHHLFRKAYPYQGSTHIPFFIYDPGCLINGNSQSIDEIVELRDVYPTLISLAVGKQVTDIDGLDLSKTMLNKERTREYLHGEHSLGEDSSQFIVTKNWKYIWYPIKNLKQLFHLNNDPNELVNLVENKEFEGIKIQLELWLIKELEDREEGFVFESHLVKREINDLVTFLSNY